MAVAHDHARPLELGARGRRLGDLRPCSPMLAIGDGRRPHEARGADGRAEPAWSRAARDRGAPCTPRSRTAAGSARRGGALARQVRLVGVAGVERGAGEVRGRPRGQEAPEAQHALERLRAVAGGGMAAAAQLALAEPEVAGERLDPRRAARSSRRAASATAASAGGAATAISAMPAQRLARLEVAGQPLRRARGRGRPRSTRRSRSSESGRPSAAPPAPGRKRAPTKTAPGPGSPAPGRCRARPRTRRGRPARSGRSRRRAGSRAELVGRCAHPEAGERRGWRARGTHAVIVHDRPRVPMSVPFKTALVAIKACPISISPSSSSRPTRPHPRPPPLRAPLPRRRAAPVRDAVAAYRNADGGFGHGLEPDGRTPGTQPAATEQALRILDQADAWDEELARGACDQLQAAAPPEGGAIFVARQRRGLAARAVVAAGAGLLADQHRPDPRLAARPRHAARVGGPGVRADVGAHRVARRARPIRPLRRAALPRSRARPRARRRRAPARRAGRSGRSSRSTPRRPARSTARSASRPQPDSIARPLFDAATIAAHLDHLAAGQQARRRLDLQLPGLVARPGGGLARLRHGRRADTLRRNERAA